MVGRRCDNVTNNNSLLFGDWRGGLFLARLLIDQCGGRRRRRTVVNNVIDVIVDVDRRVYYYLLFGRLCVFWPEPTRIVAYGRDDDVMVAG